MKTTPKSRKNLIIIFTIFVALFVAVFSIIIWQTVEINKLKKKNQQLDEQNLQAIQTIKNQEKEMAYFQSEEFLNEYAKYELEYVASGEKIYK